MTIFSLDEITAPALADAPLAPLARYILKPVVYPAFTVFTVFRTDLGRYVYGDKSEESTKSVLGRLLAATEDVASQIERELTARWAAKEEPAKARVAKKPAPKRGIAAAVSAVFDGTAEGE